MVMKLQIFMIKKTPKVDSNHACLGVISLDSTLKKNGNYNPEMFLTECKCIQKKVIWHINDNLSDFFSDDDSDDSDEEQIKAMSLMLFKKVILKTSSWRE